ncbi:MAG: hypothetical protein K0B15_04200 [Lentimicrobium sp.]|nr:hypothetical protein [Lentimicrobium sp.]
MTATIEEILPEIQLWFQLFWREFQQFPWAEVAIVWTMLFVICGYLIRPVSLMAEVSEKNKTQPVVLMLSGLFLTLITGIFYSLIPGIVTGFLLLYLIPLVLGLLSGFFHLLISKRKPTLKNAISIFAGIFYIDPKLSFSGGVWQAIRKLVWEQPQTLMGHGFAQLINSFGLISDVIHAEGVTIIQGKIPMANGVSFGPFVLVTTKYSGSETNIDIADKSSYMNILVRHELGHSLQSRNSGPIYLFKYGIPSAMSQGWTEKDAEFRSDKHFLKNHGITPVFVSYEKNQKPASPGILSYFILVITLIWGSISGAASGLIGAWLFVSGLIALFNLGKKQNRIL